MRPEQVNRWLTEGRFRAFLDARFGDHDRAVALYNWNAEVSAAFLEVLHHVEVLLRNAIDQSVPKRSGSGRRRVNMPARRVADQS